MNIVTYYSFFVWFKDVNLLSFQGLVVQNQMEEDKQQRLCTQKSANNNILTQKKW